MTWDRFQSRFRVGFAARVAGGALVLTGCVSGDPVTNDENVPQAGSGNGATGGVAGASVGGGSGSGGSAGSMAGGAGVAVSGAGGTSGAGGAGATGGVAGTPAGGISGTSPGGMAGTSAGSAGSGGSGGMSGASGAGGAGMSGQSGSAGGGGMPQPTCNSGMQDGDETGVDCGGSCDPCVIYKVDPPLEMNPGARSACEASGTTGFMCAQSMAFSPQMVQAAKDDWNSADPPFVYGVVGHDPDPGGVDGASSNYASTCCQCYQLVFKSPQDAAVSVPIPKPMIVQAFNTYAGGPTAFDVYMAVGGHGSFNGCTENGTMYSGYPDTGGDWSGGVRATRYSQCSNMGYTEASIGAATCQNFIEGECNKITASELVQSISRESCIETNRVDTHYHMNWNVVVKRIECPENLTRVTGCRLNSQSLPEGDPAIDTVSEAMSNGFRDGYHTTTMQDCCRPTCAWPDNTTNTMGEWSLFYSCNQQGEPYTN